MERTNSFKIESVEKLQRWIRGLNDENSRAAYDALNLLEGIRNEMKEILAIRNQYSSIYGDVITRQPIQFQFAPEVKDYAVKALCVMMHGDRDPKFAYRVLHSLRDFRRFDSTEHENKAKDMAIELVNSLIKDRAENKAKKQMELGNAIIKERMESKVKKQMELVDVIIKGRAESKDKEQIELIDTIINAGMESKAKEQGGPKDGPDLTIGKHVFLLSNELAKMSVLALHNGQFTGDTANKFEVIRLALKAICVIYPKSVGNLMQGISAAASYEKLFKEFGEQNREPLQERALLQTAR